MVSEAKFAQNRDPAQPRLCTFQNQEFEQRRIVMQEHALFIVVVGPVEGIVAAPGTANIVHLHKCV